MIVELKINIPKRLTKEQEKLATKAKIVAGGALAIVIAIITGVLAILNSTRDLKGSTLYVTLFPCNECAKLIIQSGVKKVIYMSDKYAGTPMNIASKKMLDSAGVVYETMPEIEVFIK